MTSVRTPSLRDAFERVTDREFVTELGVVVAMIVALQLYVVGLDNVLDPIFLDSDPTLVAVRGAFLIAGFGAVAAAYALRLGHSFPVTLPERSDGNTYGIAVLAGAVLGAAVWLPFAVEFGFPVESLASPLSPLRDTVLSRYMLEIVAFAPASGLVFHALVQSGFRSVLDRKLAVLVTALLGAYVTSPITGAGSPLWLALSPERAVLAVLFVVALAVAAYARERAVPDAVRVAAGVAVLTVLAVAVLAVDVRGGPVYDVLDVVGRVGIVGIGAYAYDRTDSVVPAALAYVAFSVVNYYLLSASLHAAFGGAW